MGRRWLTHPRWLTAVIVALLACSWGLAGYALQRSYHISHEGRVENCRAIDELSHELQLAWDDAGYSAIAARFESSLKCEDLP